MEHHDQPHEADRFDAGTGQGTVSEHPDTPTQDRPVLDGSTESAESEASTPNARKGLEDPGLIRHPERQKHDPEFDERFGAE